MVQTSNNETSKIAEGLLLELYSRPGFTERAKISMETIIKCLQKYNEKDTYKNCVYSYQNILDYLNPHSPELPIIKKIMDEYGYEDRFNRNVKYAKKAKKTFRSSKYSPGYAPKKTAKYYKDITANTALYKSMSLDEIKTLFHTSSLRINKLEEDGINKHSYYYCMYWLSVSSVISSFLDFRSLNDYTELSNNKVMVGTTAGQLADELWDPEDGSCPEIGKGHLKPTDDINVIIRKRKNNLSIQDDYLTISVNPSKLFNSFIIDPSTSDSTYLKIKDFLENIGVSSQKIQKAIIKQASTGSNNAEEYTAEPTLMYKIEENKQQTI